jgi:hypothetical protein
MNKITKKEEVVCYYREKDQVSLCTSEQFHQKTKALFSHSMIISRQELINHWVRRPNSRTFSTDHATFFLQIYNDYLQHPPLLSFGIDDNSKCGYDVFAEQEIKAYHGVATYVGCLENAIKDETYTLEKINGAAIRNLGPMINDSFPNCIFSDVSYKGFTYQFIVAIRDIKQGEKLFFNYSITHPIKSYKTHFELNLSEFESYLATDFEKEIQIYSPFSPQEYKTGTDSLKKLFNTERLIYLFHTPSVWLYLLSRDLHEPFNKMKAMLDSKGLMGKSLILNENDCKGIQTYVNKCSEVSQELSRLQETQTDISTAVKRSLGELNESYSFKTVNYLLDEILKRFKEKIDSIEEWNQYILDLKKYADLLDSVYTYLKYDTFDLEIKKFIDQLEERFSSLPTDRQNQILIIVALYNVLLNKRSSKLEALLNSNLFGPLLKDVCDNLKKIIT